MFYFFVLMTINLFETVMKRFLKKKRIVNSSNGEPSSNVGPNIEHIHTQEEINLDDLINDLELRKKYL